MLQVLFVLSVCAVLVIWSRINRAPTWSVAALICIVLAGLVHQLSYNVLAEDAFISFRYASHLASGAGFVFNPGERVEGYSNFLPTVLLAAVNRSFGWDIPEASRLLGIIFASLGIVFVYYLTVVVTGQATCGLLAALLLAASGSFMAYGPSGLETPIFALLILALTYCAIRQSWAWAGVIISLAVMTRPEGVLLALPCLVWVVTRSNSPNKLRDCVRLIIPMVVILVPWTAWRFWYYGHLLPNPLAAKMGMSLKYQLSRGVLYATSYALASTPLVVLLGIALWAAFRRVGLGWLKDVYLFLTGTLVLLVGFTVLVGGDWMPGWRFIAPAIPIACILLVGLWWQYVVHSQESSRRGALYIAWAAAVVLLFFGIASRSIHVDWIPSWEWTTSALVTLGCAVLFTAWWEHISSTKNPPGEHAVLGGFVVAALLLFTISFAHPNLIPRFKEWEQQRTGLSDIGRWLNRTLEPGTWVAQYANGAISYYSDLPTIDVLGLTDEHIARSGIKNPTGWPGHIAHDYAYVVARKPALVALWGGGFEKSPNVTPFQREFAEDYDGVSFRFKESRNDLGQYVNLLVLRSDKEKIIDRLLSEKEVELVTP